MLFSKAQGRAVMDLTTAETVGSVTACSVSARPPRIAALRLGRRGRRTLEWKDIQSFGPDAVAVEVADRIRDEKEIDPAAAAHSAHDPMGKPVLTDSGLLRGTVIDIEFDERSGRIGHLVTTERRIPGDELLGVGGYAVVVTAPP